MILPMHDHHHLGIVMSICLFHVGGAGGYPWRCSAKLAARKDTYNAPHEETKGHTMHHHMKKVIQYIQEIYGDDTKRCSILF